MAKVSVTVFENGQEVWSDVASLPLEIGRQRTDDSGLLKVQNLGNCFRVAIAPIATITLPREALKIELDNEFLKLTNIHSKLSFGVGENSNPLPPGECFEAPDEITVWLPDQRMVRFVRGDEFGSLEMGEEESTGFRPLQTITGSALHDVGGAKLGELFSVEEDSSRGRVAVELVRQALTVVQQAAGSDQFFECAVRNAANMIELDRSFVILKKGDDWIVRARYLQDEAPSEEDPAGLTHSLPVGSNQLLDQVRKSAMTVIYEPTSYDQTAASSMMALERAVAAPIVDEERNVIGVLYGDRKFGSSHHDDTQIGELEATLFEVIAGAVSSGLARQRQEAIRASMTQFFSPSVTERLEHNEDLLTGRDADVTVLFCDIRGFSGITERVGPQAAIEWINDVLTELSQCVMRTDGVLVDYVGDELMAMWGAPADQPDHAVRACEAAIEMLSLIQPLRERWSDITSDRFGFGIGVNTGSARVGNTGSKVKFKYGPLGNTVNVASRIQGITKKLDVSALVSQATAAAIDQLASGKFQHRRLALVRPLGVKESVTVHELKAAADAGWQDMSSRYEKALDLFHQSDLTGAARELASLVHEYPGDTPSVVLLGRVVAAITAKTEKIDPVMVLESK